MAATMTTKERLSRAIRGQEVDRIPSVGGWNHGVTNLCTIAGLSVEQYMADPHRGVLLANKALEVDGIVACLIVPDRLDQIRSGHIAESSYQNIEPEQIKDYADSLPETEAEIAKAFDGPAIEQQYRNAIEPNLRAMRELGMEMIPNFWELGGAFPLYGRWGYEAFWLACSLYPDAIGKIWWYEHELRRLRMPMMLRFFREYDWVPMFFCGEDVCNNQGPMVSPEMLRKHYWPGVKRLIEPLVDAGVRMVHHCDGDVRITVPDMIGAGFSGFQGFQYEVGVDPYELKKCRSLRGEEMIWLAGMSVTRTLPFGSEQDCRDEVDYFIDFTDGGRGLMLFCSNVTGVEVPPANIVAAYKHVKKTGTIANHKPKWTTWPWLVNHPEVR